MLKQPWKLGAETRSNGSGFVVRGKNDKSCILTNAHVVKNAVDIRVRLHGTTQRLKAKCCVYAPDVDLALLELDCNGDEEAEGKSVTPLWSPLEFASELPALQDRVNVIGFPAGGTTICVTQGVVSRIDNICLEDSDTLLIIQIDAAINAGNR